MQIVRGQCKILQAALPQETVTSNIARRILKLTREEFDLLHAKVQHFADDSQASLSLHKLVTQTSEATLIKNENNPNKIKNRSSYVFEISGSLALIKNIVELVSS